MARKSANKQPPAFEEALKDLESLVEAMENDQLPLEDLVSSYEKGAKLLRHCEQILAAARKRIELIEISPPDENGLETGGSSDEDAGGPDESDAGADESDDIRLL